MKLIAFEFRKNFMSLPMLFVVLILLVINAWKISDVQYQSSDLSPKNVGYAESYWELHHQFAGEITIGKINALLELYRPLEKAWSDGSISRTYDPNCYTYSMITDYHFLSDRFVHEMEYDYTYQNYAYNLVEQAKANIELYERYGNEYEQEVNAKLVDLFTGRRIMEFCYTEQWYYYFFYDYSLILVLFLCVFAMSGVFVVEWDTDMYMLITTSKRGGIETTSAKLIAAAVFVISVCLLFWIEDFLLFGSCFGSFEGWNQPIYALSAFRDTPLTGTVLQYSLGMMLMKTLGMCGCSLVFLALSHLCKKTLPAFFLGIGIAVGMIYAQGNTPGMLWLKCLNPAELMIGRDLLFRCRFVSVFGHAVLVHKVILCGACIFYFVMALWLARVTRNQRNLSAIRRTI